MLKTSHIAYGIISLTVLANGTRIADTVEAGGTSRDTRSQVNTELRNRQQYARQKQREGRVALENIKAGCVPIVAADTLEPVPITGGEIAENPETGGLMSDGTIACTRFGETAIAFDGRLVDVSRVPPELMAEYRRYWAVVEATYLRQALPPEKTETPTPTTNIGL